MQQTSKMNTTPKFNSRYSLYCEQFGNISGCRTYFLMTVTLIYIPYHDSGCIHHTPAQHFPQARDPRSCVPPTLPTAGELRIGYSSPDLWNVPVCPVSPPPCEWSNPRRDVQRGHSLYPWRCSHFPRCSVGILPMQPT